MKRTFILMAAVATMFFCIGGTFNNVCAQNTNTKQQQVAVDKEPEYPGGIEAMYQFIAQNLEYPFLARDNAIQGKVYISFVVEVDGSLNEFKIVKDIGGGCAEAAIETLKKMPKWKPAVKEGKPVRCEFTIPVVFRLN